MLSLLIIDHMKIMVLSLNYYLSPFLAYVNQYPCLIIWAPIVGFIN
jgi:hypothetical protein